MKKVNPWLILACLVVPMFASYFFDDIYSTLSHLFANPECLELGWNSADYGFYAGGYSFLCVCGGLVLGGMLLDIFGVRKVGSIFVGIMVAGAAIIVWSITAGLPPKSSLLIAYVGRMLFGLGSEIAGVAVTRSIAKWFMDKNMSLAMGLQLAVARLGTAAALIISPLLVASKPAGEMYTLMETASPAIAGTGLLLVGAFMWFIFTRLDAGSEEEKADEDKFCFSDIGRLLTNWRFICIALLCVFFYCCIVSFKKFGTAILIPRFGMDVGHAKWMISMIPFSTVVFTPLFGAMVDKFGKAERWMLLGAVLVLVAHVAIAFAPQGTAFWGYFSLALLGTGYALVPSAMWPSVPRIVRQNNLGTAYSLIYWIQNMGLMTVPIFVGHIMSGGSDGAPVHAEFIFIALAVAAIAVASILFKKKINPNTQKQ